MVAYARKIVAVHLFKDNVELGHCAKTPEWTWRILCSGWENSRVWFLNRVCRNNVKPSF